MRQETASKPIPILFFAGGLSGGGAEFQLAQLLRRLDREKFHAELVLLRGKGNPLLDGVKAAGIPVHDLGCPFGLSGAALAILRLKKLIAAIQPKILHSFGYPTDICSALVALFDPSVRVLTSRRGNQPFFRRRILYRMTNPLVDRIVSVSAATQSYAVKTERLAPERCHILINGVDLSRFPDRRGPVARIQTLGTVGHLRPIKGSDLLLDAFRLLNRPDLKLLMAGDADHHWGQKLRLHYQGMPGITFLGRLSQFEVPDFLRLLDIFVLPSRSEGMSNSLLEAMASGVAIIATDVGSNREILDGGSAGILVDPEPKSVALAIESLIVDPERATALGRRARERARLYDLDVTVTGYQKFYFELLGIPTETNDSLLVGSKAGV